jgi:hypothetical protein
MSQAVLAQRCDEQNALEWPTHFDRAAKLAAANHTAMAAVRDYPNAPRGPFGGTNLVAGDSDPDDDHLRARIAVLLGTLGLDGEDSPYTSVLRAMLQEAQEACRHRKYCLASHLLFLVQGR